MAITVTPSCYGHFITVISRELIPQLRSNSFTCHCFILHSIIHGIESGKLECKPRTLEWARLGVGTQSSYVALYAWIQPCSEQTISVRDGILYDDPFSVLLKGCLPAQWLWCRQNVNLGPVIHLARKFSGAFQQIKIVEDHASWPVDLL